MALPPPGWRTRLFLAVVGFLVVLWAAWRYVPEFSSAARVLWGDARGQIEQRW